MRASGVTVETDVAVIGAGPVGLFAVFECGMLRMRCVVVDALTRSRHDSNREMFGQGLANIASTICGGMPGASSETSSTFER